MDGESGIKRPVCDPIQTVINQLTAYQPDQPKLDADYFSAYSDFSPITVRSYTVTVQNNANMERNR